MLPGTGEEEELVEYTLAVDSKMKKLLEQVKACPAIPSTSVKEYCEEAISRQVYYPDVENRVIDKVEWYDGAQEFIDNVESELGSEAEISHFEPEVKFDTIRDGKNIFMELDQNVEGALGNGVAPSLESGKGTAARLCIVADMYMKIKEEDVFMGKRVYSDRVERKYKTIFRDINRHEKSIMNDVEMILTDVIGWYSMMMDGNKMNADSVSSAYFDQFKEHKAFGSCVEKIGVEKFEEFEEMLQEFSTYDLSDQMGVEQ